MQIVHKTNNTATRLHNCYGMITPTNKQQ